MFSIRFSILRMKSSPILFQLSKMSSLTVSPPEILKTPMSIPEKTLLGPGPSNVPDRILQAMALPTIGHLHPEFTKVRYFSKLSIFTDLSDFQLFPYIFNDFHRFRTIFLDFYNPYYNNNNQHTE